jgi:hypothetical protein
MRFGFLSRANPSFQIYFRNNYRCVKASREERIPSDSCVPRLYHAEVVVEFAIFLLMVRVKGWGSTFDNEQNLDP